MRVTIPDMWLVGRSLMHEQQGLDPRAAIHAAIHDWLEQERLAQAFEAERREEADHART